MATSKLPSSSKARWVSWLGGTVVVIVLLLLWKPVSQISPDTAALRYWIEQWGFLAPVAFYLLNVLQIVIAPLPGYPVQVLGGILFGFIPGSIYTVAGMVTGGVLAAWLARKLGRPWLEKRLGQETYQRWTNMTHIDTFWAWWLILFIPLGDIPYFLAGLSRIKLRTLALAILTSRGPFTVLIVWFGDAVVDLPFTYFALMLVVVIIVVIVGFSLASHIEAWASGFVMRWAGASAEPPVTVETKVD